MSSHDPKHEALLEQLLVESEDPRMALEDSTLAGCSECRAELEELLQAEERLVAAGREERDSIEASRQATGAPVHLVEEVLRPLAGGEAARPRRRLGLWAGLAAAAAVLIFLWRPGGGGSGPVDPGPGPQVLGDGEIELLYPPESDQAIEAWGEFSWSAELPEGGWYILRVFDPGAGPTAPPLWASEHLGTERVSLPAQDTQAWPELLEWEVEMFTVTDDQEGLSPRRRSRRSP